MSKRSLFLNAAQRRAAEAHREALRDDLGWRVWPMAFGPNGLAGFRVQPPQAQHWHWREFAENGDIVVTR